jgi:integrase
MKPYLRENGYYYVRRPDGKYKSLGTRNQREAELIVAGMRKAILRGKLNSISASGNTTLSELVSRYLKENENHLAEKSVSMYRLSFKMLIDAIGDVEISSVDDDTIQKFSNVCLSRDTNPISINSYFRHLKAVFKRAIKLKLISEIPEFKPLKIKYRHPRILSKDEIELLLIHSFHCDFEMHRYIKFALFTGCRRAEIREITWDRVHDGFCTVIGKGDRERTVPLLPHAMAMIGTIGVDTNQDLPVFYPYADLDTITKKFKSLARDCGLEDIHFHNLRHTAATLMLASGIGLPYVQEMLGHSSIKTTQIYTEILRDQLMKEMLKFKI